VLIGDVISAGPMQTLAAMMRFSGERQKLIAHNIANLSTPDFQPLDVSVADFRTSLGEAVKERRERTGGERGALNWRGNREVRVGSGGELNLKPGTHMGGVRFHDGNSRDPERLMQALTENVAAYRVAADLMRSHMSLMRSAITMRP